MRLGAGDGAERADAEADVEAGGVMTELEPSLLDRLWRALDETPRLPRRLGPPHRVFEEMVAVEWVDPISVESVVVRMDKRLDRHIDFFALARALKLPVRSAFRAPRRKTQTSVIGFDALHVHDVAGLLIWLEWMGFDIDPSGLVAAIRPRLKGKHQMTASEVEVFFYEKERCRSEVDAHADGETRAVSSKEMTTPAGYRVHAMLDAEGKCTDLSVKGRSGGGSAGRRRIPARTAA